TEEHKGVEEVYATILEHKRYLEDRGKDRRKNLEHNRAFSQLMDLFREGLFERALNKLGGEQVLEVIVQDIVSRKNDPYRASLQLLNSVMNEVSN
ncbi:MAG: hypothetical protein WB554_01370, partial [Desulfomonilaceae bacterium]